MTPVRTLFVSYNGLLDSLGQSQVLPYLKELRKDGHEVAVLSFERGNELQPERIRALRGELDRAGIRWTWLRYHKKPPVLSTCWDVAVGNVVSWWLALRHRAEVLHARSQISAAMAWPVAKLLGRRFIFDLRGQMAYEYVDGGLWAPDGLLFRLVKRSEAKLVKDADALVVLTRTLAGDVTPDAAVVPTVIPTCVDLDRFPRPAPQFPAGAPTMVYCGSLGARYALHLLVRCYVEARKLLPDLALLVVTHTDPAALREALCAAGEDLAYVEITRAEHRSIPEVLARGRFGVLLLQGRRSLRGASPTKVGEYLSCGLPVLASPGIGDCLEQLEGNRVGVVLADHEPASFRAGLHRLLELLAEGPALRERCRLVAEKEFSLSGVGGPSYRSLYRTLAETRAAS
ncbi:MAG: glycosyltransferase family 4 protein [Nitrospira sp.]|nr:glycosyltransferase family 4 protein [Nitrospira sp.]